MISNSVRINPYDYTWYHPFDLIGPCRFIGFDEFGRGRFKVGIGSVFPDSQCNSGELRSNSMIIGECLAGVEDAG